MSKKRRIPSGEKAARAKLTKAAVLAIRSLYKTKLMRTHREIAYAFGIVPSQVCYILNKKQWKYICRKGYYKYIIQMYQ